MRRSPVVRSLVRRSLLVRLLVRRSLAVRLLVRRSLVVNLLVMHLLAVNPLSEILGEVLDWARFWVAIELIWKSFFFRKLDLCHDDRLQFRPRYERI